MGPRLGRYVVLKHLASGGMADVLLGRTDGLEGFEHHVVLKRIRPENARDLRFIRMFLDEARVAANLHHQHIVQVHDIGESAGEYFIAMEYLHGEDVRTILTTAARTRQHVPLDCAIAIVSAAAAGLHYAHERRGPDKRSLGIVHRDISPSNILVGYDGSIKIVDFGIAKVSMRQETRSGNLKGKVSYMSPEQCKSAEVDRRSDVYALGVVLYELCTTTRLFKGENDYLVMDQIVNGRIALPQVRRPELPNELSTIIMRAIAPDPDRRYATADELRLALDHFAGRAKLVASTSSIAAYMHKQFGDKPEPWLDLGGQTADVLLDDKLASGTSQPGLGWTEPSDDDPRVRGSGEIPWPSAPVSAAPSDTAHRGAAIGRGTGSSAVRPDPAGTWRTVFKRPTTPPPPTDSRMGWESHPPVPAPRGVTLAKLVMIGVPLVAGISLAIWWFAGGGSPSAPAAEVAAAPAARATPAAAPTPVPGPSSVEASVTAPAPSDAAPAKGNSRTRTSEPASHESPKRSSSAKKTSTANLDPAAPPAAPPGPSPTPPTPAAPVSSPPPTPAAPAPATPAPVTPAPMPVAPTPAPAPAPPPPPVVDTAPPQLSHAAIDRVASAHRRELSKCDGGEELHGEITVRFALDVGGKVANAQVATSLKRPKVAACILRLVQAWHFDGQPAGAQGTYTVSFQ